ncbi:MAG TPA: hypothetical protein VGO50_12795 [Pyrinomonadaceae bacterium]|jgi:hypothetical protein|nr:hypothetical protein [Pyrinomonadaceae bacterium]
MPISQEVIDLENRHNQVEAEPTLVTAYEILKEQWQSGDHDREVGLHLMFLSWYGQIEPGQSTGFTNTYEEQGELMKTLTDVHAYFEPGIHQDAEMLYVVGLAAELFWFMFPYDISIWEQRGIEYQKLYRALSPNGIDPKIFHGRGYYGAYYEGQAKVENGY